MKSVFLIDGSSVFFRSFYAIRELRRSDGMPTNAVYGYVLTIRSLLSEYQPEEMVVAFDRPEKTFRNERYVEYKANRQAPPDELVVQIPYIKKVTEALGIPQFELPGYEADDLLGTLAVRLADQGRNVMVVSGDKDLLQLVNDRISVLRLSTNQTKEYTEKEVRERYGVLPQQLRDVLALMGDSIDNVPGVPGIGEKTAIALIQEYGSLEALYRNIDLIKGKKRQDNLRDHKDSAYLSYDLVTIKTDVPLPPASDSFTIHSNNRERLRQVYEELEFRSFAQELEKPAEIPSRANYQTVDSIESLQAVVQKISANQACAVDTEATSLDSLSAQLVGISLAIAENQGWYIPVGHRWDANIDWEKAKPLLKTVLESETIRKTGHNIKYDFQILYNAGIHLRGIADDTWIASFLLYPEMTSHKLDDLVRRFFGMKMTPIEELIGKGRDQISMAEVEVERVSHYACEDADGTWRLQNILPDKIREYHLDSLYREVEIPLIRVLADMERRGIRVDPAILEEQTQAVRLEIDALAQEIYHSVGKEFNLNSPLQLSQILYDDLNLLSGRKRSTRADILEKLAEEGVSIAQQILEYRHRQKIKSTYLDALRKLIRPETGRVHTTYNQALASTGRISSSDPNLQNIPIRTDLGRRVRRAFIAAEGYQLISLDYSQIELRILAHISQDPGLLSAFSAGEDIHRRTASEIFGTPMAAVTADMRRKAKEINFGLNYGMSPYGLARRLNIDEKEAASYIETYFSRYPNVRQYMDDTVTLAAEQLFVTTILGRRIATPGIRDHNHTIQDNAKRAAINAPIQGSAADLLKKAMVETARFLRPFGSDAAILLTVHDELVLEAKENRVAEIAEGCRCCMEQAMKLSIPIPVECSIGRNWADLK